MIGLLRLHAQPPGNRCAPGNPPANASPAARVAGSFLCLCARSPRHPALLFLGAALFGLIISGCAVGRVASPAAAYDTPEAALRELAAPPVAAITATARVEISSPTERYPLKAAVMLRAPADLRLESIPLLGPPDFFLSLEAGELRVFLPEKGDYHIGPATRQNIARLLRLPLSAAEVVALLMGRPPADKESGADWQGEQEEGLYRLDRYRAGEKIRSLWIDPATARLIRVRIFTGREETAYTAEFTDHRRVGDGFLPQRLTISGAGVTLAVRYTDTRLLDDETASFSLPVPEGIIPTPFAEP